MNIEELIKISDGVYITKEKLDSIDKLNERYANEIKKNHWAIIGVIYELPYLDNDEHYCRISYSYKDLKLGKVREGKQEFDDSDTFNLMLQSVLHYLKKFDKEYEGVYSLVENEHFH